MQSLDVVYHCALRFVTGWRRLTHHGVLYSKSDWPSLSVRRTMHWLNFIYKTFLSLVPPYVCAHLQKVNSHCALRSSDVFYFSVSHVRTELGKRTFNFAAPSAWNTLQTDLKLSDLISLEAFSSIITNRQRDTMGQCLCF